MRFPGFPSFTNSSRCFNCEHFLVKHGHPNPEQQSIGLCMESPAECGKDKMVGQVDGTFYKVAQSGWGCDRWTAAKVPEGL